jgi:hypothetical protein
VKGKASNVPTPPQLSCRSPHTCQSGDCGRLPPVEHTLTSQSGGAASQCRGQSGWVCPLSLGQTPASHSHLGSGPPRTHPDISVGYFHSHVCARTAVIPGPCPTLQLQAVMYLHPVWPLYLKPTAPVPNCPWRLGGAQGWAERGCIYGNQSLNTHVPACTAPQRPSLEASGKHSPAASQAGPGVCTWDPVRGSWSCEHHAPYMQLLPGDQSASSKRECFLTSIWGCWTVPARCTELYWVHMCVCTREVSDGRESILKKWRTGGRGGMASPQHGEVGGPKAPICQLHLRVCLWVSLGSRVQHAEHQDEMPGLDCTCSWTIRHNDDVHSIATY